MILFVGMALSSCFDRDEYEPTIPEFGEISLNDFSPKTGLPSTMVTIQGESMGEFADPYFITFNGVEVDKTTIQVTDTELLVPVPTDASTGLLQVKYLTQVIDMEEFVVIPGAKVASVSPNVGVAGDVVVIKGENFKDSEVIAVLFESNDGGAIGEIISVTETEVEVRVPAGGISGNLIIHHGPQVIDGPEFTFPFTGIESDFAEDENGWQPVVGTAVAADGFLNVALSGGASAIKYEQAINFDVATYPILAVQVTRVKDYDLTFETDFGKFQQDAPEYNSFNYTGVLHGDVYFWDLTDGAFVDENGNRTTFEAGADNITELIRFNFNSNIAEGIKVNYIRSFENMAKLEEYTEAAMPNGKYVWEFDKNVSEKALCDWTDHRSSTTAVQKNSRFVSTLGEDRLDLCQNWKNGKNSTGGQNVPGTPDWVDNWVYHPDYPIYAVRAKFARDDQRLAKFYKSERGFGGNDHILNSVHIEEQRGEDTGTYIPVDGDDVVFYWDMSQEVTATEMMTDNLTGRQGTAIWDMNKFNANGVAGDVWEMDWFITFESVQALQEYLANGN
ncbi:hypothetical protein PEPS_42190 (plasmid) [Persicobacter psychrovividus]|uniref:IPT/TIG domain-containing protein n=2 Tax=Persicobacter psychrovividus TaxID=387638 RepID=A0ABN6LFP5_9BACT|nr:hypothetical protein PEPS_42190 [Persicobacter psychrovividus]